MNSRVTADIYSTHIRFDGTINVDTTVGCGQDVGALEIDTRTICAVTRQVDIVCSEGVVTSYLDGTFCDRHPIQVDAAIGRIQGIGAVPFTQIEPNPRLAVTRQVDVAV